MTVKSAGNKPRIFYCTQECDHDPDGNGHWVCFLDGNDAVGRGGTIECAWDEWSKNDIYNKLDSLLNEIKWEGLPCQ